MKFLKLLPLFIFSGVIIFFSSCSKSKLAEIEVSGTLVDSCSKTLPQPIKNTTFKIFQMRGNYYSDPGNTQVIETTTDSAGFFHTKFNSLDGDIGITNWGTVHLIKPGGKTPDQDKTGADVFRKHTLNVSSVNLGKVCLIK